MADEEIITTPATEEPSSEPVAPQSEERTDAEATEQEPEERYSDEVEKKPDTVPLHVHKETRDKLKAEIRELREQLKSHSPSSAKLSEIASKWGVEPDTISELAEAIKSESTREVEARFGSLVEEQKRKKIDEAFEKDFQDKVAKNYPQLEGKKEQIKALAFTKQYVNTPLDQIAQQVFGDLLGKGSVEEARPASDKGGEVIDFSKPMSREQKAQVLKDPETRARYYSFLDQHPQR
jgi:DNA-binding transcriptional regulator YhcF (GntR family)